MKTRTFFKCWFILILIGRIADGFNTGQRKRDRKLTQFARNLLGLNEERS
jgi:hypothetical protein